MQEPRRAKIALSAAAALLLCAVSAHAADAQRSSRKLLTAVFGDSVGSGIPSVMSGFAPRSSALDLGDGGCRIDDATASAILSKAVASAKSSGATTAILLFGRDDSICLSGAGGESGSPGNPSWDIHYQHRVQAAVSAFASAGMKVAVLDLAAASQGSDWERVSALLSQTAKRSKAAYSRVWTVPPTPGPLKDVHERIARMASEALSLDEPAPPTAAPRPKVASSKLPDPEGFAKADPKPEPKAEPVVAKADPKPEPKAGRDPLPDLQGLTPISPGQVSSAQASLEAALRSVAK